MIKGSKEEIDEIVKLNVCADDGGMLFTKWNSEHEYCAVWCEHDHWPEAVKGNPSPTKLFKQGVELPGPVQSNVKKSIEKRAAQLPQAPHAETFTGVPATDLGTGELLDNWQLQALVRYANKYHLDPARGHVCLMYRKPYITIDGYLYHANQVNHSYQMASRPLTGAERKDYRIEEGDIAWISHIKKLLSGSEFTGLGIVTVEEMTAKSKKNPEQLAAPVVAKHPQQLAQKRSEWQALRRAFPIGESEEGKEENQ